MTKYLKKISIQFLVALLVFVTLALLSWDIISSGFIAYAGDNNLKFDNTSVFDDLYGSKDEQGNEFDLSNYPIDKDGDLQFYTFIEYGYSYYANLQKNFALYIYLYNPQQLDFSSDIDANVVRIGVAYDEKGENTTDYEDFHIRYVSKSTGDYNNLFYKFKVIDPQQKLFNLANAYAEKYGCRRYDIAGIYLKTDKSDVTFDKNIGRTFKCSGYMATYGENGDNDSTFTCVAEKLETLDIKVYQTSYLTGVSSAGAYHHNNVSSVYFGIPQRVFDEYGSLWEIYAQWYECKTAPILVTSNQDFYTTMLSLNHYRLKDDKDKPFFDKNVPYALYYGFDSNEGLGTVHSRTNYDWAYNFYSYNEDYLSSSTHVNVKTSSEILPLVFYSPSYEVKGSFNVINKQTVAGDVSSSVMSDYILNYESSNYVSWHTSRNLPAELFVNEVDSERAQKGITVGLNRVRTTLEDTFDLKSWNSQYGSWWDKLTQYGWSYPKDEALDENHPNVKPFEEVHKEKLQSGSLSSDLLINEYDVENFKAFCNASYEKNDVPYLFRFAVSDYYSRPVGRSDNVNNVYKHEDDTDTYLAQETVFFDFNIITMTFKGESEYHTLAVMHTPVDVISGVKAPDVELTPGEHIIDEFLGFIDDIWTWFKNSDFLKALKIIGMIIIGAIIALILAKIIVFIVKAVRKRKSHSKPKGQSVPMNKTYGVRIQNISKNIPKQKTYKKVKNVQKKE